MVLRRSIYQLLSAGVLILLSFSCQQDSGQISLQKGDRIVFLGDNLCSRMIHYGHFETALQTRFPTQEISIRNMCDPANTPGFRPRSGRKSPWAFPGAEAYFPDGERFFSRGHLETPDEWLSRLETDKIIAFFGGTQAFAAEAGLENFQAELNAFVEHTLTQRYNGQSAPELVLVSPIAYEELNLGDHFPSASEQNANIERYAAAVKEVAQRHGVGFVDVYHPSLDWYQSADLTIDGLQLNEVGYEKLAEFLAIEITGKASGDVDKAPVLAAVQDKNFFWHNDFKIPNGVHAYGVRFEPYGPDNYPDELKKIRQMTAIRDQAIWAALKGQTFNLKQADALTHTLPRVETNFKKPPSEVGYKYGKEAENTLTVPPGYKVALFASEEDFPELANPAQLSFDNQGRLWVATLESYPHYKPGAERPNDKLVILEDTDQDGRADKSTVWADGLSLPIGFEFAPEGVYVSQAPDLVLLSDTDGDDRADKKEIILSGFDDHDTHHAISAFCADPSGAIYMGEGIFLHSNIETAYGPERGSWSGFWRYDPQRRKLERTAQPNIPNPWGIAFDELGNPFFAETSSTVVHWMTPSTMMHRYGDENPLTDNLIEEKARVRPTSGLEFVSSRHFPDEVQGDLMLCNSIGFLGIKQHRILDQEAGFDSRFRQDLLQGTDPNFRPVDLEFAPDGSLYVVDWHNVLIGHMQHNARDPLRDHVHGRIYRITYPSRPLVEPAQVAGAPLATLLDNLKLPEYRTRYRSRRELRGRDQGEVLAAVKDWINHLEDGPQAEQQLLEALWVTWGVGKVDQDLLRHLLSAEDFRIRAAAVRVLRYTYHQFDDPQPLFLKAARDNNDRVRTEVMMAASWLEPQDGAPILSVIQQRPMTEQMQEWHKYSLAHLNGDSVKVDEVVIIPYHLEGDAFGSFMRGQNIYKRDGYCVTCHQMNGKGLASSGFPPLAGTRWVNGDPERLIKLTLHGLYGPIEVLNKDYPGQVPMTPYGGMLNDQEIADVLTFVRNAFDNRSGVILANEVARVRAATANRDGFYEPAELLNEHPFTESKK